MRAVLHPRPHELSIGFPFHLVLVVANAHPWQSDSVTG